MSENKFASVLDRVEEIANSAGGGLVVLEEGTYAAKVIGLGYRKDVEKKKFESEELEKVDEIVFMVQVRGDDAEVVNLIKEVKVSGHEKSSCFKILSKFELQLRDFPDMLGKDVRVSVEEKTSKAGKQYNVITNFLKAKANQDPIKFTQVTLPSFFGRGISDGLVDLVEGVTIKEETEGERRDAESKPLDDAATAITEDVMALLDDESLID